MADQTTTPRGMIVSILKNAHIGDCTNGGVTSKATKALLVGEGIPEVFSADEDTPVLLLEDRGQYGLCAVPMEQPKGQVGPMMGGNFIWTSDSRVRRVCEYPVPVHDRFETQEMYDRMFR